MRCASGPFATLSCRFRGLVAEGRACCIYIWRLERAVRKSTGGKCENGCRADVLAGLHQVMNAGGGRIELLQRKTFAVGGRI